MNIFIDESGDFGDKIGHARFYVVSFVFHNQSQSIDAELTKLNDKLMNLSYNGMIHFNDLVNGRNDYKGWPIDKRKKVMWAILMFAKTTPIKLHSIIIDRSFINNPSHLKEKLSLEIDNLIFSLKIPLHRKIDVFYDCGQKPLKEILNQCFKVFNPRFRVRFNKREKRLFQVADMLTFIDKVLYRYNSKDRLSKSEERFFTKPGKSLKSTLKDISRMLNKTRI